MSKQMFENFGYSGKFSAPALRELEHTRWTPVREFIVRVKLSGFSKKDVSLEIDEGMLILRGPRSDGSFHRAIPIPDGVNPDTTTAVLTNGVLEIRIVASPGQGKYAGHVDIQASPADAAGTAAA